MGYSVKTIDSVAGLRDRVADWDDLWQRSSVENPLALAEPIALWMERFEPNSSFRVITIEENGRLVAAFPLYGGKKAKIISAGMNPSNGWSHCGQLLVDWTKPEETPNIMGALISGFRELPFSILWLNFIRTESPEWKLFRETLSQKKMASQRLNRYETTVFPIDGEYEIVKATWKKKAISQLNNLLKRYDAKGYSFDVITSFEEAVKILPICFEIENQSWKGEEGGGSMIKRGMTQYCTEMIQYFASKGQLLLAVLSCENKLIAFNYCIQGKSTVFCQKLSFLPDYRELSPGQTLQFLFNRRLLEMRDVCLFDFVGEKASYQQIWNSTATMNSQIVLPLNNFIGKSFFFLYDRVMPVVRKLRKKGS